MSERMSRVLQTLVVVILVLAVLALSALVRPPAIELAKGCHGTGYGYHCK